MTDLDKHRALLDGQGWLQLPAELDAPLLARLRSDLEKASEICRTLQIRNGLGQTVDGSAHHVVLHGESFLQVLDRLPVALIEQCFGGPFILNSFGGVVNIRTDASYLCKMHRDVRTFSKDSRSMLNLLIMLDDFTVANGATFLLSGSHKFPERPSEADFFRLADRATGPAGSLLLFDSNLWHAAGVNSTDMPRRALTLTFTAPFRKPQFDYPRALGYDRAESLSEQCQQILGYFSRVPATLDEWYQPPERRLYRSNQG
ncbi:MAG TPA: phytanoyl-CoA dioxygenase family protein [Pirellulales bacterium]|nr:phytanoyl-CoA dioxygenase family protein [Pirellulales bacterium]